MAGALYSKWGRVPRAYELMASLYLLDPVAGRRRRAIGALELARGQHVLDLCCGTGLNLAGLLECVGAGGIVVALDRSAEMLDGARARRRGVSNVRFHEADATATGLDTASFDGVLCVLGLSVVPDPSGVVREARRVLKPGGRFVVLDGGAYRGAFQVVNPVVRPLLRRFAGADADRDFDKMLRREFAHVGAHRFQGGSIVLAVATAGAGS